MAVTENLHTGNGSKTNYSFTFPYLKTTDIKVSVDGSVVNPSNYTAGSPTATEIQFNTAPANNAAIRIYRDTATDNLSATFYAGSAIKSEDLNDNFLQNLYVTQEAKRDADAAWQDGDETINSTETWHTSDDTKVATTKAIEGRIDTKIDTALTTDVIGGQSITVTDNSPSSGKITVAVTDASIGTTQLANDAVNGDKIADDAIDSEHYAAGSIDNEHLANDAVGIDELGPNAVVNASVKSDAAIEFTKLENLDSAKILVGNGSNKATEVAMSGDVAISNTGATTIQSGAVERGMLAADLIDGTKIDDDAVDSEHLAAGSIDTEHIADANVTLAKIENVADTKIIVGNGSNRPTAVTVSGDVTIANTGAVTIANNAITEAKITDQEVTTAKLADSELRTLAGMQSGTASILAGSTALTATTAELNLLDNKTFKDSSAGTLNTTSDTEIPSSKVIAAHVASSQTAIGGFVTIADEVSFPATASMPANGVVVSINNAAGVVVNGSGVSTTGRTTDGTPATVTINNFPSSLNGETLAAGVGLMVTATSTSNTYNYHKLLAAETDVKQLSDDINDFNARYRVASSAPGSNNDDGDLYFDTTANKMKVYNATTSAWDDVASVGNFFINTISSSSNTGGGSATFNGSAYRFTLSNPPTMAQQLIVSVNGVIQKPNAGSSQPSEGFAIDGNDIIFAAAPASGADYFIVTQGSSVSIGTPSDNTVSTAKIQNLGVTNAKIANDTIAEVKLDIHNTPAADKYLKYTSNGMEWADGASEGVDVKSTGISSGEKFLKADLDGTCSWQTPLYPTPSVITVADESSDTDCNVWFSTTATGNISPKTGTNLTFNSSTGALSATSFIGSGTSLTALNATNLGSGTVPTARLGSGTANSGSFLAGNNTWQTISAAPEITATTSGTLPNGCTVIVNTDGTVSKPAVSSPTFGSEGTITNASGSLFDSCWLPAQNVIVVAWMDSGNSNYLSLIAGSVSGTTITWGSKVTGYSTRFEGISIAASDTNSTVCVCGRRDVGGSTYGIAVGAKVTGTSISVEGTYNMTTGINHRGGQSATVGGTNRIINTYTNSNNYNLYSMTITLQDNGTLSLGSQRTIETQGTNYSQMLVWDSSASRMVCTWTGGNDNRSYYKLNSGGSSDQWSNSRTQIFSYRYGEGTIYYDPDAERVVLLWDNPNDSNRGYMQAGEVSSSSITWGSAVTWNDSGDNASYHNSAYTTDLDKGLLYYRLTVGGNHNAYVKEITCSGSSLSAGTAQLVNASSNPEMITYLPSNNYVFMGYAGNKYKVRTTESSSMTTENFIGFSSAAYTNGQTATIKVVGNTVTGLSGLTAGQAYYVQNDGSLNQTPWAGGTVQAGVALSSSTLLIK